MPVIPSTGRFIYIHSSIFFQVDILVLALIPIQTIQSILSLYPSNTDTVSCVFLLHLQIYKKKLRKPNIYATIFHIPIKIPYVALVFRYNIGIPYRY